MRHYLAEFRANYILSDCISLKKTMSRTAVNCKHVYIVTCVSDINCCVLIAFAYGKHTSGLGQLAYYIGPKAACHADLLD